jgi:NADH-quinone oxidoreductase subunit J
LDPWTFWLGGTLALGGGLLTVTRKNAVASVLWLIVAFLGMSTLFLGMDAGFIGVIQILVYAGAIMILFLFVIMLLNLTPSGLLRIDRPRGTTLGLASAAAFIALIVAVVTGGEQWTGGSGGGSEAAILERTGEASLIHGSVLDIADQLFNAHLLPFEAASVLLLVAMVGAVALTKRKL